ncbi:hypothetical protein F442_03441 [Phytophthora nicotianae P10297]|uniref:BED-type domain-containing protein n=1 Tax=Phytophthora nicotianae P10297 TaxID=1317064 RepID=W2ZWR5_PHYNI|nr:hypothetical protein F442_03441 [Phytophthora nicotianae P10297]
MSMSITSQGPKLKSKVIVEMMFRDPEPRGQTCKACNLFIRQTKTAGYTNLINHLASKHSGYEDVVRQCMRDKRSVTMDMFVDQDALSTHQWMNLVVNKNFPFMAVDDGVVRSAIKYNSMNSRTLKARMVATVELVEPCLQEEFKGEKFALVFDGVTDGCEHSLAVFAATQKGIRFLTLSSFGDEKSMTADEHIRFLDMVLNQYKLEANNLIAIVCDNMETNKAISRRIDAPMIGCAAHRFNLAVKEYVQDHRALIKKVASLMRKLKSKGTLEGKWMQAQTSTDARAALERTAPNDETIHAISSVSAPI